jgi:glycosyltransferase involved in cell wall biosynthesis
VDDGSTDNTIETARSLQSRYGVDRIVVVPLAGNQGAQVARNRGMESARGEMLLFCDSDDVLVATGVALLAEALSQNPALDYAYGKVVMTDATMVPLAGVEAIGGPFEESPFEIAGYHWHTMGALYRKSFLDKVGPWNLALTGSQDWEYQARVKLAAGRGLFVDTLVGFWRQHDGGRVGAKKFRPDYVRSVAAACDVIMKGALKSDLADLSLRKRLAKKLILHALECGASGDVGLRSLCFAEARAALRGNYLLVWTCTLFSMMPSWLDDALWSHLTKRKL